MFKRLTIPQELAPWVGVFWVLGFSNKAFSAITEEKRIQMLRAERLFLPDARVFVT